MPMNWTAENDRILLLKLIETHGIAVDPHKIVKAWPDDAPAKPTPRAITERFVKLRKTAGIKATITTTPSKPRQNKFNTPSSSARKRKSKIDSESDGKEHMTEEDTPTTKRKATQKGIPGGLRRGALNLGNGSNGVSPSGVRIKKENPDNSFDDAEDLRRLSRRASELHTAAAEDGFKGDLSFTNTYGMSTPSAGRNSYFPNSPSGMDRMNGHTAYNFMSGQNGMGNMGMNFSLPTGMTPGMNYNSHGFGGNINGNLTNANIGMPMVDPLASPASRLKIAGAAPKRGPAANNNVASVSPSVPVWPSVAPSDASSHGQDVRARSIRKASQQASEGMHAWMEAQKAEDREDGMKSSEEDSAASEFHESEGEYV